MIGIEIFMVFSSLHDSINDATIAGGRLFVSRKK